MSGRDEEFVAKLRSLHFSPPSSRGPKRGRDDNGNTVTEHFNDRVDVTIDARNVRVVTTTQEG